MPMLCIRNIQSEAEMKYIFEKVAEGLLIHVGPASPAGRFMVT
jgi:hypothetical protein